MLNQPCQSRINFLYNRSLELRKTQDWLVDADFGTLETTDKSLAYILETKDSSYLVVANLSDKKQDFCYDFLKEQVVNTGPPN